MTAEIPEQDVETLQLPKNWNACIRNAVLNVIGIVRMAILAGREALVDNGDVTLRAILLRNCLGNDFVYKHSRRKSVNPFTMAECADVEFESLLPLDENGSQVHASPIYGGYQDRSRCIIQGDWKLMYYSEVKKFRLFNLEKDPHELSDVADKLENKPLIHNLLGILIDQQQQLGDSLPMKSL